MSYKESGDSYGCMVENKTEFKNPKDYRWLIVLLSMVAFLVTYSLTVTSVVYGAEGSYSLLDSYYNSNTASYTFILDLNGEEKTYTLTDVLPSYANGSFIIGVNGSSLDIVRIYLLNSESEFYYNSNDNIAVIGCQYVSSNSEGVYKCITTSSKVTLTGFDSGAYIVHSTEDIYKENGELFFQSPPPWTILTGVTITSPLAQILTVLGTVLTMIVAYLAIRKAIQMIMALLKVS